MCFELIEKLMECLPHTHPQLCLLQAPASEGDSYPPVTMDETCQFIQAQEPIATPIVYRDVGMMRKNS